MKVRIYQIAFERDKDNLLFRCLETVYKKSGGRIPEEIYELVYEGELEASNMDDVFYILNAARPEDYKARSLSVSDVIEMVRSPEKSSFYFCDSFGFSLIPFDRAKVPGVGI